MAFTVPGLRARTTVTTRARPACIQVRALAGGRWGSHRSLGDMQVLHYRSSNPTIEKFDAEIQPSATATQLVLGPEQERQLLAQTVVPRDLLHQLQMSQVTDACAEECIDVSNLGGNDRLQMAKGLHSVCAGSCCNTIHKESHSAVSAPSATFTLPAILSAQTSTGQTATAAVLPSREKGDKQTSTSTCKETAATKDGAVETMAVGAPVKMQLKPVVYTFPHDGTAASTSSWTTNSTTEVPARSSDNSNGGKALEWGNTADALGFTTSSTSPTAPDNAPIHGAAASQKVSVPSTTDPANVAATTAQPVKRRARVVRQEDMPVVQIAMAQAPDGTAPNQFYMPDPLALPCLLEASAKPCEAVMSYDSDLVECMWLEAGRIATLKRDYEEAAARRGGNNANQGPAGQSACAASTPFTKVELRWRCETQPGERLWLIGDNTVLGAWSLKKAVKLRWSEGHIWRATVELPIGAKVSYKAVLQLADTQYQWESCSNHVLEVDRASRVALVEFK